MSTPPKSATPTPFLPPGVDVASAAVNLNGLDPALWSFFRPLGLICMNLLNTTATITSAHDSIHVASSKHGSGKAVDFRVRDFNQREYMLFLLVLIGLSTQFGLAIFDESNVKTSPHIHVEVAG